MKCSACDRENVDEARFCGACGAPLPRQPEEDAPGLVGTVLGGRYTVKRVIAEGGMGVVYAAEQPMGSHVREVAIKTLLPELSRDQGLVARFYRETGTVAQLEHPNTIKFYDFGEAPDGTLYIAMEFVRGQPLSDLIAQGPIPLERTEHILRQVCGALDEAHALGIVHRDLKPDNIVLTARAGERDFVKLLDFGIAARTGPAPASETKLTQQGQVLGTPPYMSPEQLAGQPIDGRSDIYSLGVIAYEMLTGHLPFEAETPWQWAQKHLTEPPRSMRTFPAAAQLPERVERAVMRALSKQPEQRPASTLEFYRDLSGQGDTENERAPDTSPMRAAPVPIAPAQHTAPTPFTPAYQTTSAVAAPVPPAALPRPRPRRVWPVVLGGLLVVGGAAAAITVGFSLRGPASSGAPTDAVSAAPAVTESTSVTLSSTQTAPADTSPTSAPQPEPKTPARPAHTAATHPTKPRPAPKPSAAPPVISVPSILLPKIGLPQMQTPSPSPPTPAPKPQTPTPPVVTAPAPKPKLSQGDAACRESMTLASQERIEAAVTAYQRCRNTGGSAAARSAALNRIRVKTPSAVLHRAYQNDCAGAHSAANAASQVGVGSGQAALKKTKC